MNRLVNTALLVLLLAGTATLTAASPRLVNYQGRLTDAGGTPLADGPKNLRFIIWNDPVLSAPMNEVWNSGPTTVTTTDGLFTIILGASPQPALDPVDFADTNLWLGITVGADPEITPRTRLTASPYLISGDQFVRTTGDTMSGPLGTTGLTVGNAAVDGVIDVKKAGLGNSMAILQESSGNGAELILFDDAGNLVSHTRPISSGGGVMTIYDENNAYGAEITGGGYSGLSDPSLVLLGNSNFASLDLSETGDATAQLPDNAINAAEILNEPGIASNYSVFSSISPLAKTQTSSTNFLSVTITTPASGYIVVDGQVNMYLSGEGVCFGWAQISETSSAAAFLASFQWINASNYANTGSAGYTYQTVPLKRIFFKPAGSFTFYMQGNAYSVNTAGTTVSLYNSQWLTATFFPTSYGSVVTPVPATEDLEGKNALRGAAYPDGSGEQTIYTADLRQLELKAAETARKAAEAQLELERARFKQHRSQKNVSPE